MKNQEIKLINVTEEEVSKFCEEGRQQLEILDTFGNLKCFNNETEMGEGCFKKIKGSVGFSCDIVRDNINIAKGEVFKHGTTVADSTFKIRAVMNDDCIAVFTGSNIETFKKIIAIDEITDILYLSLVIGDYMIQYKQTEFIGDILKEVLQVNEIKEIISAIPYTQTEGKVFTDAVYDKSKGSVTAFVLDKHDFIPAVKVEIKKSDNAVNNRFELRHKPENKLFANTLLCTEDDIEFIEYVKTVNTDTWSTISIECKGYEVYLKNNLK